MEMINKNGSVIKKYDSHKFQPYLFLFIIIILLDIWIPWRGFQDFQFASTCRNTNATVRRVEKDGKSSKIFVEYNDYTTGLPTEGVIQNEELIYSRSLIPRQEIEILYVSGMYQVYSPEVKHPSYKSVYLYAICELFALWFTFYCYRALKYLIANRKK
ncbi:MAG: hypothetical protein U0264_04470 [Candidatus Kapaibacterium sp.]